MKIMKNLFLLLPIALFTALPGNAQLPRMANSGSAITNVTATNAGAVTSLAITITPLNLTAIDPAVLQCWTGTTTRSPIAITNFTVSGSNPITTITPTFASTANVTCTVNSSGGAGATGPPGSMACAASDGLLFGNLANCATELKWDNTNKGLNLTSGGNNIFALSADLTSGDQDCGALLYINCDGSKPPTVSSATAHGGTYIGVDSSQGGDTSIATTGTGGTGGEIVFGPADGGRATAAETSSTGGNGARFRVKPAFGGAGGALDGMSTTAIGGNGGPIVFETGNGGAATGVTSATGGNAANFTISLGVGGIASGAMSNTNGSDGEFHVDGASTLFSVPRAGGARIPPVAVGSLPTCNSGAAGTRHSVTDSNAASFTAGIGAIVANGGATKVPVYCDGTNWRIG